MHERRFLCNECGKAFVEKRDLCAHLIRFHFEHLKRFLCQKCAKKFATQSQLDEHVRRVHTATRQFLCNLCSRAFSYRNSLEAHFRSHSKERRFVCERCGRALSSEGALRKHRTTVHESPEPSTPCFCGKVFQTQQKLRYHVRTTHRTEFRFFCPCGQRFRLKCTFKAHQLQHSGDYLFCHSCPDTKFSTKARLKDHILARHGDPDQQHQFHCHLCPSAFHWNSKLSRHYRLTHGRSPPPRQARLDLSQD